MNQIDLTPTAFSSLDYISNPPQGSGAGGSLSAIIFGIVITILIAVTMIVIAHKDDPRN
ncbi:hypothetical protein MASR2M15_06320 [Anaerolineales bacterium]